MNAREHLQLSNFAPFTAAFTKGQGRHLYSFKSKSRSSARSAIAVTGPDGRIRNFDQEVVGIGASPEADLQIGGSNIAEQHAEIFQKHKRTYCKALAGDEQDVTSSSHTWLDDSESSLRTGVAYLLAPKACISFGEKSNSFVIDFEEESKGRMGVMEMLMQNLAASGSEEVRKQVKNRLDQS